MEAVIIITLLTQTTAPSSPGATHWGLSAHTLDSSWVALQLDMGCPGDLSWRTRQALTKQLVEQLTGHRLHSREQPMAREQHPSFYPEVILLCFLSSGPQ